MSDAEPTADPEAAPEAPSAAASPTGSPLPVPRQHAGHRTVAASTVVAWIAVGLFVSSAAFLTIPVTNPGVQSCGAPGLFLVHGTQDASLYDTDGKPIHGFDQARLRAASDHRCSKLVAERGVPAALLAGGFLLTATLAFVLSLFGHRTARQADLRAWSTAVVRDRPLTGSEAAGAALRGDDQAVGRTTNSGVPM